MALGLRHYPPSIEHPPAALKRPSLAYLGTAVLMLLGLVAFLGFYLGLIAGTAFLVYLAVVYHPGSFNYLTVLLKIGAVMCSVMLFLFLVKGLFKQHHENVVELSEIREADHPDLFAFIRRLCREMRAPFPYRVFLSPDLNAAVFFDFSLLNLVVPVRKNLVIGLGLVNALNITEFKAVLAHEFGHFSQGGMTIGQYVYVASRVVQELVFGEDRWDEWMESWRGLDFRLAIFGWFLTLVVWLLKWLMIFVFSLLGLIRLSLSRQMEYHADLRAASVVGSDALVHALARLTVAEKALGLTYSDLSRYTGGGLFSRDLYQHHVAAIAYLQRTSRDPQLAPPPPLPEDPAQRPQVFRPTAEETPALFRTHPTHYERELNLKRHYVRGPISDESPWVLFRNPEAIREAFTAEAYHEKLGYEGALALGDPARVQARIDEGRAESKLDSRYHGVFDHRLLNPGNLDTLMDGVRKQPWPVPRLARTFERVYSGGLREWVEAYCTRIEEHEFLEAVERGRVPLKKKQFPYRGRMRRQADAGSLRRALEVELKQDREWLSAFDQELFQAHYQMALTVGGSAATELEARCRFHLRLQEALERLLEQLVVMPQVVAIASAPDQYGEADRRQAALVLKKARDAFGTVLAATDPVPALTGGTREATLGACLRPESLVSPLYTDASLPYREWVQEMAQQLQGTVERAHSLHQQSLADLLKLQERIAGAWRAKAAARMN